MTFVFVGGAAVAFGAGVYYLVRRVLA
jgi:uncharacterized protein YjeT (DUF2065 family)